MEHQSRRRGISLVRHKRSESMQTVTTHAYHDPPVTYFNYPRYTVNQMVIRHTSTPKTSVSFRYPINPEGLVPTPLELRHYPLELSAVEKVMTPKVSDRVESNRCEVLQIREASSRIEKYHDFEHCKEVIGNRLFGASPKSNKSIQYDR